jgi:cyclophilin family peptidyl-prolyl cis-trans isomerase
MRSLLLFTFIVPLIFSCKEKTKATTSITNENLVETLTKYGKENPENAVRIETDYGVIKLRLYDETPLHRANFIKLVKEEQYERAEFYRIFYQFMIQGGIFPAELPYTIPAEFNKQYIHKKGALSMAQSEENNPEHRSSATEFFIVQGSVYKDYQVENDAQNFKLDLTPQQKKTYSTLGGYMSLDQQYTVFGEVTEGLDVVDKIASVKVYETDKPLKKIPLKISVSVEQ